MTYTHPHHTSLSPSLPFLYVEFHRKKAEGLNTQQKIELDTHTLTHTPIHLLNNQPSWWGIIIYLDFHNVQETELQIHNYNKAEIEACLKFQYFEKIYSLPKWWLSNKTQKLIRNIQKKNIHWGEEQNHKQDNR